MRDRGNVVIDIQKGLLDKRTLGVFRSLEMWDLRDNEEKKEGYVVHLYFFIVQATNNFFFQVVKAR